MHNEQTVKAYMRGEIAEHVDLDTLEVNCTTLAKDAAQHFDAHEIPEEYFGWALEVEEEVSDAR